MQAVPGYPHLYRREAVYWLRRRVPKDLLTVLPFNEWRVSLGTKALEDAKRALHVRLSEIDSEIAVARAKASGTAFPPLTQSEAASIAKARLADWLTDDTEARRSDGSGAFDNVEAVLEATAADDRMALAAGNWQSAERIALWALEDHGRWYPAGDPSVQLLAFELLKVRVIFNDMITGRQRGDVVETPAPVQVTLGPVVSTGGGGLTLATLIRNYRAEREADHGVESTSRKYGHIFKALEEVLGGDRPVASIKRADCRAVRDLLVTVPASAGKRYPGLTLREAAEAGKRAGTPVLSPNTVNTYLQNLSAVFNWAVKEEVIGSNPAQGLVKKGRASVKRRGLADAELRKLFTAVAPFRDEVPSRFWLPALALYTGARLGELCQLTASDIGVEDGVAFINFSEFAADGERVPDRSLKTVASDRRVPIHADQLAAGFLTFVERVREGGGGRLFPECRQGPDGGFSHDFSRWFGRTMDALGLNQRSLVFHSFRHGFKDACRDAEIAQEVADALGGWSSARVAAGYGDRGRLKLLANASARVTFDGFTLADIVSTVPAVKGHQIEKLPPSTQKKDD